MDIAAFRDVGTSVKVAATPTVSLITAGSNSGTAVTCAGFDRQDASTGALANSLELELAYSTTLAATKTFSIGGTITINTAPDNSTWTSLTAFSGPGVLQTGSATVAGVYSLDVGDLTAAARYIQVVYTPTLSNTSTDTATITALGVFGGFDRLAV